MSLSALLNTARDALRAQSFGVSVTSQNITNANTPGYVRRDPLLETQVFGRETYGSVGVSGILRSTDRYLEGRYYSAFGMRAAAEARDFGLAQVEATFTDFSGSGIAEALSRVSDSFSKLSVDPGDTVLRENVLGTMEDFAARVRSTAEELARQRTEIFNDMQARVSELNEKSNQIANLNREIIAAEAQGKDASDLRDRRNQVLLGVVPIVDVKVVEGDDGAIFVQAAGATLVEGTEAREFQVDVDANGDVRLLAQRQGASNAMDITRGLSGGALAGLRELRDVDIKAVASRLDSFAYEVGVALNAQHQAGFGLDGGTGRNLFQFTLPGAPPAGAARSIAVSADVAGLPERIGASSSGTQVPGSGEHSRLLARVFESQVASGGTRTPGEAYADMVGDVGLSKSSAMEELELREVAEAQFFELKESHGGVSLDEEMVNLTKYQRAYQAASKVLTTVDEMLNELLTRLR